tara:strand:+ start:238 stop:627 length:390 start_codon:yes stop_codon:yes gene_type:complete
MIDEWLKYQVVPFKHQGRDFDGADCWGLVYLIYQNELGINLPECSTIGTNRIKSHTVVTDNLVLFDEVEQPQKYDIVLLRRSGYYHVAMFLNDGWDVIHTSSGSNVLIQKFAHIERTYKEVKILRPCPQ